MLFMPFDGSYIDHEKSRYQDSQDCLVEISKKIIRDPLSTHVIKTRTKSGKIRFLIVDRTRVPEDGDIAVVSTDNGIYERRDRYERLSKVVDAINEHYGERVIYPAALAIRDKKWRP